MLPGKSFPISFILRLELIDDLKAELHERARELAELAEKVEFRQDCEAMLKGTNIEVHRIAALLGGGMTPGQICEDYPSLTPEAVATAKVYADAHPKVGPPYPSITVKRAIKGAGLEALDEVLDEEK
jgi:hypoxanthine phosphoribosyltransferase